MAVPILSLVMDIHQAVPLSVLVAFFFGPYLTRTNRRTIDFKTALPMVAAGMIGVPVGVTTLSNLDANTATMILGIAMTVLVIGQNVLNLQMIGEAKPWKAAIAGTLGGVLGGAFNTSGPPVVVYLHLTTPPKQARSTMYFVFLILGTNTLINQMIHGLTTMDTLKTALIVGWCGLIGAHFGGRLSDKVPTDKFKRIVTWFIVLLGVYLVLKSLIRV
jgi:uncharacterized membrane protein YfcA